MEEGNDPQPGPHQNDDEQLIQENFIDDDDQVEPIEEDLDDDDDELTEQHTPQIYADIAEILLAANALPSDEEVVPWIAARGVSIDRHLLGLSLRHESLRVANCILDAGPPSPCSNTACALISRSVLHYFVSGLHCPPSEAVRMLKRLISLESSETTRDGEIDASSESRIVTIINRVDPLDGGTLLHAIINSSYPIYLPVGLLESKMAVFDYLLAQSHCDPNVLNVNGECPLALAVRLHHYAFAYKLLACGADVTPLNMGQYVFDGSPEDVTLLKFLHLLGYQFEHCFHITAHPARNPSRLTRAKVRAFNQFIDWLGRHRPLSLEHIVRARLRRLYGGTLPGIVRHLQSDAAISAELAQFLLLTNELKMSSASLSSDPSRTHYSLQAYNN